MIFLFPYPYWNLSEKSVINHPIRAANRVVGKYSSVRLFWVPDTLHLCTSSVLQDFLLMVLLLVLKLNGVKRPGQEQSPFTVGGLGPTTGYINSCKRLLYTYNLTSGALWATITLRPTQRLFPCMNTATINTIIDYEVETMFNRCFPCRSICTFDAPRLRPTVCSCSPLPCNSPLPAVVCVTKHSDLFSPQQGGLCLVKSVHIYDRYAYIIHIERNL